MSGASAASINATESPATEGREAQLLAIARRLFARRGYDATSLREIAEEADITKAALYYYFPNKDALYERVVIESMDSLLATVKIAVARSPTPTEKIRAFLRASADIIEANRDQWAAGSNAFWQGGNTERRGVALRQRDEFERLLRGCIENGVAQGELRSVNPALATRLLLAGLNQLVRWHRPDGALTTREVIDQYLDITLLGMVSRAR